MKMKRKYGGLCLILIILLVAISALQHENVHAAIDLSTRCSLTINTGTDVDTSGKLDLDNNTVAIDLYKVAGVVKEDGYNNYIYTEIAAYHSLMEKLSDTRSLTSQDWRELAQEAAAITLQGDQPIELTTTGFAGSSITDLDCGLYLVLAHGADLNDYFETIVDENTGETRIVTIAKSKEYKYSFQPELISLPVTTREEINPFTIMNTADASAPEGEWVYDAKAVLKYEYDNLYGDLEIVKKLLTKDASAIPTFVYSVEAELDGVNVYSDVVSLKFADGGMTKTALIADKIPVGAQVTVTEIYTGTRYKLVSGENPQKLVIPDPTDGAKARAYFENDYDPDPKNGQGIINKFSNEDGWKLDNEGDNSSQEAE